MSLGYLDGLLEQLLTAKKCQYSEDSISFHVDEDRFFLEDLYGITNPWQERLKCTLVQHRRKQVQSSKCIVYMHGMGSTRLQALSIIQHLPNDYCLCMFDMSGCGKSQGSLTTYGIKESHDIEPVISHLHRKLKIQSFVLWGRSMGAVAALLHARRQNNASNIKLSKEDYLKDERKDDVQRQSLVKAIVLDSPFYNFRDVAKETAIKNFSIPSILADAAVSYMQSSFSRILSNKIGQQFHPFLIDFSQQITLNIPIIVVYSERDEVVPSMHSQRLIRNIRSKFERILINQCSHNEARPAGILRSIFEKLEKYSRALQYQSKRAERNIMSSSCERKRGIFVFTPSKEKELRNTELLSARGYRPPSYAGTPIDQYTAKPSQISMKSTASTPRRTKLTLQSSQMLIKTTKQEEKSLHTATLDTETNNIISNKMIGISEMDGRGTKIIRSRKFNMQKRKQVRLGRPKHP